MTHVAVKPFHLYPRDAGVTIDVPHVDDILKQVVDTFGRRAEVFAFPAQANPNSALQRGALGILVRYDGEPASWKDANRLSSSISNLLGKESEFFLVHVGRNNNLAALVKLIGIDLNWPANFDRQVYRFVVDIYRVMRQEIMTQAYRKQAELERLHQEYRTGQDAARTAMIFNLKRMAAHIAGPVARVNLLLAGQDPAGGMADIIRCEHLSLVPTSPSASSLVQEIEDLVYDRCEQELDNEEPELVARLIRQTQDFLKVAC